MFLGSQYSNENIKVLMNFFTHNSNENSKALLLSISKIIDIYQSNQTSGSKIPLAPN